MNDNTIYFKTFDQAWEAAEGVPKMVCVNRFQSKGDTKTPKVVSFAKGYAVQFGDCGEYMTKKD